MAKTPKQSRSQLKKHANETKWSKIREGLKLRSIMNAKRMNEHNSYCGEIDMEGSFLSKKLVIHRQLGISHVMPGAA